MRRLLIALLILAMALPTLAVFASESEPADEFKITFADGIASWTDIAEADAYEVRLVWGSSGFIFEYTFDGLILEPSFEYNQIIFADVLAAQDIPAGYSIMLSVMPWRRSHQSENVTIGLHFYRIFLALCEDGEISLVEGMSHIQVGILRGSSTTAHWIWAVMIDERIFLDYMSLVAVFTRAQWDVDYRDYPESTTILRRRWHGGDEFSFTINDVNEGIHRPVRIMFGDKWFSLRHVAETLGYEIIFMPEDHLYDDLGNNEHIVKLSR